MKIKLLSEDAICPTRGTEKSAGLDLYSSVEVVISPMQRVLVPTGISIALPSHSYGSIRPRSGLANKHGIDVLAGVIDEDYRGEVGVILINLGEEAVTLPKGSRIAQLIVEQILRPVIEIVDELDDTDRSGGGFGSTGI